MIIKGNGGNVEIRFVSEPNLPKSRVKTVLLGEKYAEKLGEVLGDYGVSFIKIPENPKISPHISAHADMSVCHIGGNKLIAVSDICDSLRKSAPSGLQILESGSIQKPTYPGDISLNACIIGDKLFHCLKYTDVVIISEAKQNNIKCYNIKQGYTKCSVCVLSNNSIITSDKGIHELAEKLGIRSLKIRSGFIELCGYDTGFIGGCCGKLSENKITFTGKLNKHPDENRIINFISDQNIEIIFLTDKPIFDVGSIIPIEEYDLWPLTSK